MGFIIIFYCYSTFEIKTTWDFFLQRKDFMNNSTTLRKLYNLKLTLQLYMYVKSL